MFEGLRHVDRNMTFGLCAAPKIWCTFFGLVMWIAIHIHSCADLMHYMDDAWSYETDPMLIYYAPHDSWFPHKQVTLLQLYDDLGLPHDKKKQVFGLSLDIIGLHVDPHRMTISMSDVSRADLVTAIRTFIDVSF